jgi:hypothetical protein
MVYDAGSSRLSIMISYSVGVAIIAVLTIAMVPHKGFVVGDDGCVNWKNGAKVRSDTPGAAMTTLRVEPATNNADEDADDVKMLDGQRSDASDSATPDASPPDAATEKTENDFKSLPFSRQARSPRHILLLVIFGTTIARMAFFFGTFNAQVCNNCFYSV